MTAGSSLTLIRVISNIDAYTITILPTMMTVILQHYKALERIATDLKAQATL